MSLARLRKVCWTNEASKDCRLSSMRSLPTAQNLRLRGGHPTTRSVRPLVGKLVVDPTNLKGLEGPGLVDLKTARKEGEMGAYAVKNHARDMSLHLRASKLRKNAQGGMTNLTGREGPNVLELPFSVHLRLRGGYLVEGVPEGPRNLEGLEGLDLSGVRTVQEEEEMGVQHKELEEIMEDVSNMTINDQLRRAVKYVPNPCPHTCRMRRL